jgi:hypothetical protein
MRASVVKTPQARRWLAFSLVRRFGHGSIISREAWFRRIFAEWAWLIDLALLAARQPQSV